MATVRDILARKGSHVHAVSATATVLDATRYMNDERIGSVVVVTQDGRLAGIFTERDVLRRIVAEQLPPQQVRLADVMTTQVLCCEPDTPIEEVGRLMKDRRVRHVPVCDSSRQVLGLVSIGDINAYHLEDQGATIHLLEEYIHSF